MPALIGGCGPWQILKTGLPLLTIDFMKDTAFSFSRNRSGECPPVMPPIALSCYGPNCRAAWTGLTFFREKVRMRLCAYAPQSLSGTLPDKLGTSAGGPIAVRFELI